MESGVRDDNDPIAIVGLGCRFPGDATSPTALWDMLLRGESAWTGFPQDRIDISSYFHPQPGRNGSLSIRGGHFLNQDVAAFDSSFFHISSDEAKAMDPQQRMLLEVSVEALDSAGIDRNALRKSETGVWIGSFIKDYEQICLRDMDDAPVYAATGNGTSILSNRISYFLDINGPSMTIDTGCSASLVCVHNACQSLRTGEVDMALAGGTGLILSPNTMMPMTSLGFLSPDGKSYAFDARANGYGRGEGIGIVVLKRLQDAIRDNDNIRAVIRGTRVNQDGRTSGITLPSYEAQVRNIRTLYQRTGLDPTRTAFVECHGTGTQAGDTRELMAISNSLCETRAAENPIIVGSIKTNIGHLEGGAGIAGLVKGILAVENGIIPKHINFEAPGNPAINFEGWKVKVPIENTNWPVAGLRRASINSFGFGGTNAHVIVDDAAHYLAERRLSAHHSTANITDIRDPSVMSAHIPGTISVLKARMEEINQRAGGLHVPHRDNNSHLFVFSAHDQDSLSRVLMHQKDYLLENQDISRPGSFLEDLAYTLGCRRTKMQWRYAITAQSIDELITKLQDTQHSKPVRADEDSKANIAFVFGGQGAQWYAMGRELMGFDTYLESVVAASTFLSDELGSDFSLLAELLRDKDSSRIDDPEIAQTATTVVQVALVDLLVHRFGITPTSVVGHSSGEIAAAYASGMVSRETAWELAYRRGQCIAMMDSQSDAGQTKGRMMAVGLSQHEASEYLVRTQNTSKVTVACINSPKSVTLSGDEDAILEIQRSLENDGVFNRLLKVNVAYHSHHMYRCAAEYLKSINHLKPREPSRTNLQHPHTGRKLLDANGISLQDAEPIPFSEGEAPAMYSSVRGGERVDWQKLGPFYWVANLVSTVQFSNAFTKMMRDQKPDTILELGPHASLQSPIAQILDADTSTYKQPKYLSALRRNKNAAIQALQTMGELWCRTRVDMAWVTLRNIQLHRPRLITDLPNYPWNHEVRYWHESDQSLANRLPKHGRYDLVGRPTPHSTPFHHCWRGFLCLDENPWIEQHQVQKTIIYPAAGMVAMVIEGARQLASEPVAGIEISHFKIEKAIIIPRTKRGLEYTLDINRHESSRKHIARKSSYPTGKAKALITYEFSICSKPLDGAWQQNGHGTVIIHSQSLVDTQAAREDELKTERYLQSYLKMKGACDDLVIPRQLYETLDVIGLNYGPLFRNIVSLYKGNKGCSYAVRVPDTRSTMPAQFEYPHIIHPATLDSIIQTALCLSDDSMVPSYIGSIYISLQPGLLSGAGKELVGYAQAESQGIRKANVTFVASDKSWLDSQSVPTQGPLVVIKNMSFTALSTGHDNAQDARGGFLPNHHNLCSQLIWESAPDHLAAVKLPQAEVQLPGDIFLLVPQHMSPTFAQFCTLLSKRLKCSLRTLESIGDGSELAGYCVSVLELLQDHPLIWDWSEKEFTALRTVLNATEGVFWLTQGAQIEATNPRSSLFQALARTIHSESPQKNLITVDIDANTDLNSADTANKIVSWFSNSFCTPQPESPRETEFSQRGDALLVSRLVPMDSLNRLVKRGGIPASPTMQPVGQQPERPLKAMIGEVGRPDSLFWDDDPKANFPLPADCISIRVLSAGLSGLDTEIVMGQGQGHSLGTDAYGIIDAIGDEVQGLAIGDRVLAIARGSLSRYTRCHYSLVQKVADEIDDPSIVLLPTSLAVADYGLYTLASLKAGQTVLVHSGAGTFGQAAIRLAKHVGANVLTTVTSEHQREVLTSHFSFPEEWILDANGSSVIDSVMRLTDKKGVDVIFDPASDYPEINQHCVANSGYVVAYAKKDTKYSQPVDFTEKTFTYAALDLRHIIKREPWRLGDAFKYICSAGIKDWIPRHCQNTKEYTYSELPKAINDLTGDSHCGLAYCVATETAQIPVVPRDDHHVRNYLRQDATYVLAGQGGLSMHIAKMLAANGVTNIALLSRSGTRSEASQTAIAYLQRRGVNARVVQVDICDRDALERAAAEIRETMPPVRGVFQCAAALRDAVFDNMTHADWQAAARPKTVGSWNLYEVFPRDMDFLVFLSSSAGVIGNRGQANYAAGNAFQDALARHISGRGAVRSVSIDLGPVLGAGMLAEDTRTLDRLKATGFLGIRLQDFSRVVERAVAGYAEGDEALPPQIVVGVGTGGLLRQNQPADPFWARKALFAHLNRVDLPPGADDDIDADGDGSGPSSSSSFRARLSQAADAEEARAVVAAGLREVVARGIGMRPDEVDEAKAPNEYGVDSLVATSLRGWVFTECGVSFSVFEAVSDTSIAELSASIVEKGGLGAPR